MKTVTDQYKNALGSLGRQYKVLVSYEQNNQQIELSNEDLNIVTPHYEGDLLKSVMKQLDLDSNVDIPIGTEINCQFGLLVGNAYEYIDYGNYIVYSSEKQEDLKSYKIVCYDKMLNAMKDYEALKIGKNIFDQSTFTAGDIVGPNSNPTIRITSMQNLYLKAGTYTFSWNGTSPFRFAIQGQSVHEPPVSPYPNLTFNSGWQSASVQTYTFTLTTDLWVDVCLSKENNATLTIDEIKNFKYQIEESSTATNFEPFLIRTFPMTVKDYLTTVSYNLNIPLATQTFVNDDTQISEEKYLDSDGNSLGYTYRDVLDEVAQATASTICINENDELEVRYLNETEGKNLCSMNSSQPLGNFTKSANQSTWTLDTPNRVLTITPSTSSTSANKGVYWQLNTNYYLTRIANKDTTISFYAKADSSCTLRYGVEGVRTIDVTLTTEYKRYSVSFNRPLTSWTAFIFYERNNANVQFYIKDIQVELGNMTYFLPLGDFTIDETWLKDTNVNFKEKYGPINSVVFSRSGDSDLIYRKDDESIEENGLCELKIKDNQLLNGNDRDNFIDEIYNQLNGLEYYVNDYTSTGITILELCDKYNVKVGENIYPCVMFNDELNVTQGFDEMIHTDKPETNESDYKKADTTDRRINQAYIIVDKQKQEIEALTDRTDNLETLEGNDKQELLAKFGDYALDSKVNSLTTQVQTIQTDTYTRTQVKQILKGTFYDENNNQVVSEVVKTISGTFDENGMTYAKTNAKTSTTINEIGVRVNNTTSNDELLFAGYDDSISQTIVRTDNIVVRNYINIGTYSRLQDYETGTGVFDI